MKQILFLLTLTTTQILQIVLFFGRRTTKHIFLVAIRRHKCSQTLLYSLADAQRSKISWSLYDDFYVTIILLYSLAAAQWPTKYTYICRVQSSVWHLSKYWPPTPSPPCECVLPPHQRRGGTHSPGGEEVGGHIFNVLEDARHWIGLLQYNPSTQWSKWSLLLFGCGKKQNLGKMVNYFKHRGLTMENKETGGYIVSHPCS